MSKIGTTVLFVNPFLPRYSLAKTICKKYLNCKDIFVLRSSTERSPVKFRVELRAIDSSWWHIRLHNTALNTFFRIEFYTVLLVDRLFNLLTNNQYFGERLPPNIFFTDSMLQYLFVPHCLPVTAKCKIQNHIYVHIHIPNGSVQDDQKHYFSQWL